MLRRWSSLCFAAVLVVFALYHLAELDHGIDFGPGFRAGQKDQARKPIDWKAVAQHYPLSTFMPLPTGAPVKIPKVQASFPAEAADRREERLKRRDAVKDAFVHSWRGYTKYAW
jgi:mannosyl-oligosaccharide alpha-1,2-mannosidase